MNGSSPRVEDAYHIPLITPLAEPGSELEHMSEPMDVNGLVRVANIMVTISEKPMNVGGGYKFD